ncbi:MAG: hypothetical protein ACFB4I_17955 [Cyanophyceae cyanobacterium]
MVLNSHRRNPHALLQEALALCERLEQGLGELADNHRFSRIDDLIQVTDALKNLTAQSDRKVARLAHRLETIFRSLAQQPEVSSELVEMVLQAYEYLRLLLIAQSQADGSGIGEAFAQAESVFTRLEQLACPDGALGSVPEPVNPAAQSIAGAEVEQILNQLAKILSHPSEQLVEELLFWLHRLLELGKMLEILEVVAIARSTSAVIETNPQSASTVGKIALAGLRSVQTALDNEASANTLSQENQKTPLKSPANELPSFHSASEETEVVPERLKPTDSEADLRSKQPPEPALSTLKITELFVWRTASTIFTLPYTCIEEHLTKAEFVQFGEQQFLHWRQQVIPVYQLAQLLPDLILPAEAVMSVTPPWEFNRLPQSAGSIRASPNGRRPPLKNQEQTIVPSSNPERDSQRQSVLILVLRQEQLMALESEIESLISETELLVMPFNNGVSSDYCRGYTTLANGERLPVIDAAALLRQRVELA